MEVTTDVRNVTHTVKGPSSSPIAEWTWEKELNWGNLSGSSCCSVVQYSSCLSLCVFHRSSNPSLLSDEIKSRINSYDAYGNLICCLNSFAQCELLGCGSSMFPPSNHFGVFLRQTRVMGSVYHLGRAIRDFFFGMFVVSRTPVHLSFVSSLSVEQCSPKQEAPSSSVCRCRFFAWDTPQLSPRWSHHFCRSNHFQWVEFPHHLHKCPSVWWLQQVLKLLHPWFLQKWLEMGWKEVEYDLAKHLKHTVDFGFYDEKDQDSPKWTPFSCRLRSFGGVSIDFFQKWRQVMSGCLVLFL